MTLKQRKEYLFRHFSMRLYERYGLFINYEYYEVLCKVLLRCRKKYKGSDITLRGYIFIHGNKVKVLKDIRFGNLLTALPIKN
jgi:hypothetical protein